MNVNDVMSKEPCAVRMVDRLDEAARILWEQDCGFVPVVDGADVLVGVLTDRDLCMASYTQGKPVALVPVLAVMARELTTCGPDDSLATAMDLMAKSQVHRLPVVDARGVLLGVLSSNDLLQVCQARPAAVAASKVLATLAAIAQPRTGARDFAATKAVAKKPAARKRAASANAASASAKSASAKSASATADAASKPTSKAASKPATKASKSRGSKSKP